MLVVSNVNDVFLPSHHDLLVNLTESRAALVALLGGLDNMFAENHVTDSALGPGACTSGRVQAGVGFVFHTFASGDINLICI